MKERFTVKKERCSCGAPSCRVIKSTTYYGKVIPRRCCLDCLPEYLRWQAEDDQFQTSIDEYGYPAIWDLEQLVLRVERMESIIERNTGGFLERYEDPELPGMEDFRAMLAARKSWVVAWDKRHSGKTDQEIK